MQVQAEDRARAPTRIASGLLAAVAAAQLSLIGMHDVPNCDSSAAYTSCGPLNKLLVSAGAANALPGNYSGTPQIVSPGDAKAERDGKVHLAPSPHCQSKSKALHTTLYPPHTPDFEQQFEVCQPAVRRHPAPTLHHASLLSYRVKTPAPSTSNRPSSMLVGRQLT